MKVIQKSGAWLWALLAALLLTVLLTATAFAGDNDFRCWTVDARQWTNQGYQSEKDGVWYLFLPQDESPADTVLSFSGRVTAASAGALDREGGTLTGAFADRDRVTLTLEGGRTETVCLRQSSLPSLRLTLNGTTLDQIHQDKDVKYPGNDLVLTDGDDVLTGTVEIKGRGNSTWREYAKKPYQIKFSKKTSVLGMPAAKKWILLANASDDSMIRTRLVYDAAEQMDFPFVTEYQYVDLWIDGQYLGVYLLGEKAEIGKGRLNLQDPAGAMFELDNGFATDEDHYFFEGRLNSYFALKEIVEEDDGHIQQAMTNFQTAMTRLTTALTSQGWENLSLSQLNEMIDVDSLARYYLMNEYVLNGESFFTSFFWYQDGASDVLHVGPLWDFDTCMGNKNEKVTDYNASSTSVLMKKMLNIPAFYQRVQDLYARYKPLLTGMAGQVDGLRDEIGVSADLNYLRWSTLGTANPKPGGTPFAPTYDEALSRVRTWLTGRAGAFTPTVRPQQLGYYFNASRTVMYLTYSAPSQTSLRFAVWGQQDGQNDLHWYQAKQQDGRWVAEVPLVNHQETGTYMVHVYNQNGLPQGLLDHGTVVVDNLVQPEKPALKAALSADGRYLNLTLTGGSDLTQVWFPTWSEKNGQDDLQWYEAKKQADGSWTYSVALSRHNTTGTYFIHAYGNNKKNLVAHTTAYVEKIPGPEMKAALSADGRYLDVTLTGRGDLTQVWFPTWSQVNGQDDLRWHEAARQTDGSWTCRIALSDHSGTGVYFIHAYGNTKKNLVAHTTAYVEKIPGPEMKAALSADGRYLDVTLTGRGDLTQVWFPTRARSTARTTCAGMRPPGRPTAPDLPHRPVGPLRHRRLLHPRLRQYQEESGGPHHRYRTSGFPAFPARTAPPAGPLRHAGGAVRRWAVPGCDPGGPQRPDEGLVPHLERRERPGRSALVRGHQAAGRLLDLPGASGQPQERGRLLPPRLRQQQEEPGGPHHRLRVPGGVPPGMDPPPRRRPLYDRDPDGPQRSDEGLVPHLGRSQRPGRPAVVPGGQAVQRRLVLYREPVPAPGQGHLLHPCLRQYQTEPGGPHHRLCKLKGGTAPRREHPDQVLEIKL